MQVHSMLLLGQVAAVPRKHDEPVILSSRSRKLPPMSPPAPPSFLCLSPSLPPLPYMFSTKDHFEREREESEPDCNDGRESGLSQRARGGMICLIVLAKDSV